MSDESEERRLEAPDKLGAPPPVHGHSELERLGELGMRAAVGWVLLPLIGIFVLVIAGGAARGITLVLAVLGLAVLCIGLAAWLRRQWREF